MRLEDALLDGLSKMHASYLSKRQFDFDNPPMPGGDHFGHDGGYYSYYPKWAMITSAVILGLFFLGLFVFLILYILRRRKPKSPSANPEAQIEIQRAIAHQRRMSGISDTDPDNIKPIKRLRSFHMKGAMSPDSVSSSPRTPRTPKTPGSAGLFSRFFRKGDNSKRLPPLDEERNDSYASLNAYPDTPALDEKMLEASPPPTPAPAFGWSANVGPGGNSTNRRDSTPTYSSTTAPPAYSQRRSTVDGSMGKDNDNSGIGEQNLSYKGDTRPPIGQHESDSFLQTSNRRMSRDQKRLSSDYNENYQTRPSGGLFDDDEIDERRPLGYDPDSRSGH
ncbi:hypothetical protein TWF694_001059 [Orbilia ellipsospora]|uniref:Uncharacterized protein n=1 Tax=Orbilia ellipsospora TaxID=2528407 RepID=A0AAV9XQP6_9PEZI